MGSEMCIRDRQALHFLFLPLETSRGAQLGSRAAGFAREVHESPESNLRHTHLCVANSDLLQKKRNRKRYTGSARKSVYRILFDALDNPLTRILLRVGGSVLGSGSKAQMLDLH